LIRHASASAGDRESLTALGFTRRGRASATMLAAAPALAAGLVGAIAVAIVLSPLFPRGLARRAEPHPGIRIDRSALALGAVALLILLPLLALVSAWVTARRSGAPASGRARVGALERLFSSLPTVPSLGARFALGRDRRGVVVGLAGVVGAAFLVAGFVAVSTVLASRDQLFHDTRLFGAGWDLEMDTSDPADAAVVQRLASDPGVDAVGTRTELLGGAGQIRARGPSGEVPVTPFTDTLVKGFIPLVISSGRAPADGEVLIGRKVASALGARIGDTLTAEGFGGPVDLRVSGLFVNAGGDELDQGFTTTMATLERLRNTCPTDSDRLDCQLTTIGAGIALRPGTDERATVARLVEIAPGLAPTPRPSIVGNLGQIGSTPWLLAAFLAVIGAAGLAHALIVGLHRGRRELAITRALGLRPRQAREVISCQALTMGVLGAIVGLAVGAGVGRLIWQRVARGIGAVIDVQVPLPVLVLAPLVAICLGLGLALATGRSAAALRPVDLLRAE
jgi:ABC-type lipoprotein release transport system permease subunit